LKLRTATRDAAAILRMRTAAQPHQAAIAVWTQITHDAATKPQRNNVFPQRNGALTATDRNRKRCLRKQRSQINFTKEKEKNNLFSSFQSVYFAVYEGMLLFLSLVLLRCDLLDEQLKIWRKEEDEILLFGSLVWLSLVSGFHWFGFETLCAFWSIFGIWVVNGKRNQNWVGCLMFEAPCESTTSF
jgi:hypothetical protein